MKVFTKMGDDVVRIVKRKLTDDEKQEAKKKRARKTKKRAKKYVSEVYIRETIEPIHHVKATLKAKDLNTWEKILELQKTKAKAKEYKDELTQRGIKKARSIADPTYKEEE